MYFGLVLISHYLMIALNFVPLIVYPVELISYESGRPTFSDARPISVQSTSLVSRLRLSDHYFHSDKLVWSASEMPTTATTKAFGLKAEISSHLFALYQILLDSGWTPSTRSSWLYQLFHLSSASILGQPWNDSRLIIIFSRLCSWAKRLPSSCSPHLSSCSQPLTAILAWR